MRALKFLILSVGCAATLNSYAAQVAVHVEPVNLQGPRPLEDQSKAAVVRDYIRAWQSFDAALGQNRPELLDADFVGTARDKLSDTIQQQAKLGIRSQYQDRSHDLQILFYSPDGNYDTARNCSLPRRIDSGRSEMEGAGISIGTRVMEIAKSPDPASNISERVIERATGTRRITRKSTKRERERARERARARCCADF